jgi:hypothetical protein
MPADEPKVRGQSQSPRVYRYVCQYPYRNRFLCQYMLIRTPGTSAPKADNNERLSIEYSLEVAVKLGSWLYNKDSCLMQYKCMLEGSTLRLVEV